MPAGSPKQVLEVRPAVYGCPEEAQANGCADPELTKRNPFDTIESVHKIGVPFQDFIELG